MARSSSQVPAFRALLLNNPTFAKTIRQDGDRLYGDGPNTVFLSDGVLDIQLQKFYGQIEHNFFTLSVNYAKFLKYEILLPGYFIVLIIYWLYSSIYRNCVAVFSLLRSKYRLALISGSPFYDVLQLWRQSLLAHLTLHGAGLLAMALLFGAAKLLGVYL